MSKRWLTASLSSGGAQIARMLAGLVLLKLIVVQLGPTGVGRLGHFMNLLSVLIVFGGGGILTGVVKYVAEYRENPERLREFLSAASAYSLLFSGGLLVGLVAFAQDISRALFGATELAGPIIGLALAQAIFGFINFVTGLVNGLLKSGTYARITIVGTLMGLAPAYPLVSHFGIVGAVYALIALQAGLAIPAAFVLREQRAVIRSPRLNRADAWRIGRFSIIQMFSVATMPLAEIYIRNVLSQTVGWDGAGMWQGVQRLSYAYLSLFITFLSVYYMPTLSGVTNRHQMFALVRKTAAGVALPFLVMAAIYFFGRTWIFSLLLTSKFLISSQDLLFQLTGDFFRILAYTLTFVAVARAATLLCVLCELAQSAIYLGFFTWISSNSVGGNIFKAYAASYLSYFLLCLGGILIYSRIPRVQQAQS